MRKKRIYLADILAILMLIAYIFAPFINFQISQGLKATSSIFFMAYLAFLFAKMPKGRPLFLILPLVIYTFLIFSVFGGASFLNNKEIFRDILKVCASNFPLIGLALVFYGFERFSSKIFGSYFSIFLAFLGLLACGLIKFTSWFTNLYDWQDYFLYLGVFLIFANLNYKKKPKTYLYPTALALLSLEILLYCRRDFSLGFFLSPLFLLYLIFAREKSSTKINFEKYFIFGLIFIFPVLGHAMDFFLHMRPLALELASLIISFFVSVILFEAKNKILSYTFLGLS